MTRLLELYPLEDETKVEMFGCCIPFDKHGGGGVIIWVCFANTGPMHLVVIEPTTNFSVYQIS